MTSLIWLWLGNIAVVLAVTSGLAILICLALTVVMATWRFWKDNRGHYW